MKYTQFGECYTDEDELFELLYQNPELDLSLFAVLDPSPHYNAAQRSLYADVPKLEIFTPTDWESIEQFDSIQQSHWHMPNEYKELDIAQWLLDQCKTDAELQRIGEELLLYQERNLFNLLRYLKYMVDTFRDNKVLWGLGRGSSVASYALYLIGVHKINSMYYDLDIGEFLR